MPRIFVVGTLTVVFAASALRAQDDTPKQLAPAEEYRAIVKDYQSVQQDYIKAMQAAQTNEERQKAATKAPKPQEFATRFLALAKKQPAAPVALDALLWIAQNSASGPVGDEAVSIISADHIQSPKLAALFERRGAISSPAMEKLAHAVLQKSSDTELKRQLCLALAVQYKNRRQNQQAEKFLQRLVDEFGDADSLMQVVQSNAGGPSGEKAVELLIKEHVSSPGFAAVIQRASALRQPGPGIEKLFRAVLKKSDSRDAKGHATFGLAQYLKNQAELAQSLKGAPEARIKQYESYYGADLVQAVRDLDIKAVNHEVEKLLEDVVENYSDVAAARGTLGAAAEPDLFELRFLSVGKTALDIEAEDIDGETFKLSDYRGKVVMLDFWGHW